jgi:hypothetical protein
MIDLFYLDERGHCAQVEKGKMEYPERASLQQATENKSTSNSQMSVGSCFPIHKTSHTQK